ncbi:phosphoribosylglycinamide formyltransferase [Breoghania sp. L-A4]|uniref:phosphoribosylglycinamide formyltransferase n=1 Tax=Breoghania sp. L-A4 TaxID=2304600 RepID=UPI000E35F15D|nr:phosphoribosylglycinamide formyltransferase [Breoghania sp. L-A4]AXS40619.1 phosphoribosylglycinamide formyltransferase [Breoghania sp. L-A4]
MSARGKKRVAILISGRGSNMVALLDAARDPAFPADIVLVASNRPDAAGLAHAKTAGIPTVSIDHTAYGRDRAAFDAAMNAVLVEHDVELVCLAGFLRLLTPGFVEAWSGRMINVHPALLPSFKGLDTHARALEAGVKIHGATVHFVSSEMDAGAIIVQGAVPVLDADTEDALAARVLAVEHAIYPMALGWVASGRARLNGQRVTLEAQAAVTAGTLIWPAG